MGDFLKPHGLWVAALAVAGCTAPSAANQVIVGKFGGVHSALTLTTTGGTIEYDCAHGGVSESVRTDGEGRFDVAGVHVREHGGPIRDGEIPDSVPARYVGRVQGREMTLTVFAQRDTLGPFVLRRDEPGQLFKCL